MRRASWLAIVGLAACGSSESELSFSFRVQVQATTEISAVTLDGESLAIGDQQHVSFERAWLNYAEARRSAPLELVFLVGDQTAHIGQLGPGACVTFCSPGYCIDPDVLVEERISIYNVSDESGAYLDFTPTTPPVSMACIAADGSGTASTPRLQVD